MRTPLSQAEARELLQPKRNKYNVAPKEQRTYGGRTYDSKAEMVYAQQLDVWKQAGAVKEWFPQVPFILHAPSGEKIGSYVADFRVNWADGSVTWVDVKGLMTPLSRWKIRHCESEYSVKIQIVK